MRVFYNSIVRTCSTCKSSAVTKPPPVKNKLHKFFKNETNGGCHPDSFTERIERQVWKNLNINRGNLANEQDEIARQLIDEYKPDDTPPPYIHKLNDEEDE